MEPIQLSIRIPKVKPEKNKFQDKHDSWGTLGLDARTLSAVSIFRVQDVMHISLSIGSMG